MATTKGQPKYVAWCGRCYTSTLYQGPSKKAAAIACTGHQKAYGCPTGINDYSKKPA